MKDDDILEKIFKNVNDWLNFAERKNTTILSIFGFITIFSVLNYGHSFENNIAWPLKIGIIVYLVSYLCVLVATIISLMPVTEMENKLINGDKNKKFKDSDNLWFYGDIIKYSQDEYKDALEKKEVKEFSEVYKQLIPQIIINSHIASKKYSCFKFSAWAIGIGIFVSIACFIINLI